MATGSNPNYTVEQANRALPLIRAIVGDLAAVAKSVEGATQRLDILTEGRKLDQRDPYDDELSEMRRAIARDTERVNEYLAELKSLSLTIEPGRFDAVTFPSKMDGKRIVLVWQLGEPEVLYWHEPGSSFEDRQPLVVGSGTSNDPGPSPDAI